jgi:hypothetical protein
MAALSDDILARLRIGRLFRRAVPVAPTGSTRDGRPSDPTTPGGNPHEPSPATFGRRTRRGADLDELRTARAAPESSSRSLRSPSKGRFKPSAIRRIDRHDGRSRPLQDRRSHGRSLSRRAPGSSSSSLAIDSRPTRSRALAVVADAPAVLAGVEPTAALAALAAEPRSRWVRRPP